MRSTVWILVFTRSKAITSNFQRTYRLEVPQVLALNHKTRATSIFCHCTHTLPLYHRPPPPPRGVYLGQTGQDTIPRSNNLGTLYRSITIMLILSYPLGLFDGFEHRDNRPYQGSTRDESQAGSKKQLSTAWHCLIDRSRLTRLDPLIRTESNRTKQRRRSSLHLILMSCLRTVRSLVTNGQQRFGHG